MDIITKHDKIGLSLSGGVDSCAIALGMKKTGKKFFLINKTFERECENWNKLWQNYMAYDFAMFIGVPILVVPREGNIGFPELYNKLGISTFIIGDGMDRCFGQIDGGKFEETLGEDFHCMHPFIDKFGRTVPTRLKSYKKKPYEGFDKEHKKGSQDCKKFGVDMISVSLHPKFVGYFKKYNENVRDIFFPKMLYFEYVKKHLGMSYYSFCKKVYINHKNIFKPFGKRLLDKINNNNKD
jgi:hypothetical protein